MKKTVAFLLAAAAFAGCTGEREPEAVDTETADEFVERVNRELTDIYRLTGAAGWVRATYITHDTAILDSAMDERYAEWHTNAVEASLRYEGQDMAPETARALKLLKLAADDPAPADPARRNELAKLATELSGMYGAGRYCPQGGGECLSLTELEDVFAASRDYDEQLEAWTGWRTVSVPMRDEYARFVELLNEGARGLGFADLGDMWKSKYDMEPDAFAAEAERLWNQVSPLYEALHCHVRAELSEHYGAERVPLDGPIPAHLLGNMWAQQWSGIYDLLEPYPGAGDLDLDAALVEQGYSPVRMVESAEAFYVSMGLPELPDTFWTRSLFEKPADRDVQCHASAWGLDGGRDLRIKMCIEPEYEDLKTIYHELGHNYYQGAYSHQPALFRDGAHGGFHEAIGDTVLLSMTPGYLSLVGLLDSAEESPEAVINRQMLQALDNIAFLPFGKLIDEWRWDVFSGETTPDEYNAAWWELRERYQGIAPPVERGEEFFDPGAKYHVPANVSYTRYFLARILQFQFQRALCDAAGHDGPLYECSVYGSEEAGRRLQAMLEAGASEPWQDTLEKLTGTREMDASAITEYFEPLAAWLEERNEGRSCGW